MSIRARLSSFIGKRVRLLGWAPAADSKFPEPAVDVAIQHDGKQFTCITASRAIIGLLDDFKKYGWKFPRTVVVRWQLGDNGSYLYLELI